MREKNQATTVGTQCSFYLFLFTLFVFVYYEARLRDDTQYIDRKYCDLKPARQTYDKKTSLQCSTEI